mmetsp:Transcript_35526/g.36195  ORF Transcript_35526/g.36195 Transcript_35526/m.36195 type:complete len:348 (+) Transcript_35526:219-1262(+)|eukprot:CAMPEP_0182421104 /NCGR_PEP_ID=MMETSP1167-20130531/6328_1 /TAXON_ID=2988 /ORGANISM="Mallomonas Sp, Strain CCMP3275" /LENGTH=347 /DNA_ID=CAMNT_0024597889 /DNA_START=148 /DNA_END=1191 /DNA_ORIENTATION=+
MIENTESVSPLIGKFDKEEMSLKEKEYEEVDPQPSHNKRSRLFRFYGLVLGIMFFFGCHNYMQELIMTLPGFKIGVFLGYLEVLGVAICSYGERIAFKDFSRRAPWSTYFTLCLCLMVSSAASNFALGFINYPTKVVFRSCKLIPTILIAMTYLKKTVHWFEIMFGVLISLGMILFAAADFETQPNFNPLGIGLVSLSVVADAFLPNFQERVFDFGASRVEVTYYTNILCLAGMTFVFSLTGDLQEAIQYSLKDSHTLSLMLVYTFLAYLAITLHMTLVKEFGGITAVLVGNTRKAMTILLSFLLFPKPSSMLYVLGGVLVFGSLVGNAVMKERQRRSKRPPTQLLV